MTAPLKPLGPYKVAIRDLPATRTVVIDAAFVQDTVKGMTLRDLLEGEGVSDDGATMELEMSEDGENVFARGTIEGTVTVACSRCVKPAHLQIDDPLMVTFIPAAKMPKEKDESPEPAEDGVELEENDLDVFPYDGEIVDLEPLIREQFVLAIPYAPLCREDCAGLCAQCGTDKNLAPCNCEKPIDPRFAGLQALKLPS